ncbi:MAG: helix-hairpin-helix domain-containing protein [Anaerolineales bacterium]|nr:MAG: helix-hairpin-helix domain-containing protein [Anaerolineales bacterium]
MSNFLMFLNNAGLDTLIKVPGVGRSVAENLIAARPFESEEDALNVKGMGRSLLAKLELFAEAQGNESENKALIPVEEEALPAPVEKKQPEREPVEDEPSLLSRLGRAFVNFLRALLKLILVAALIVVIGAALYYGLPYIQRTFIAPVEQNTAEIQGMDAEIASLQTQLNEMKTRVDALESSAKAHTLSIQKLEEMQAALETELRTNNSRQLLELKQEVMFTRALDILARARLYLAQSNFGLAEADVQTARSLLAELQSEKRDATLAQAISRLDLALGNLPDFPVVASGDLEIAWQILISGNVPPTPTPTPVPPSETPTPKPTLEVTPTMTP